MKIIDIFKINKTTLQCINKEGIKTHYVNYIDFYNEYSRLVYKEGHKKSNAMLHLSDRFGLSESVAFNVIKQFEKEVKV
jgi:hypothetical protein